MGSGEKFGRTSAEWDEIVSSSLSILEDTARARSLIAYSDLAERITRQVGATPPVDHHLELRHVLYDTVLLGLEKWPDGSRAPLISALAVYKDVPEPGPGHITLARELGRRPGPTKDAELEFWAREVEALHAHYA